MGFGLSFGSSSKTTNTNSNSQSDPWEPAIPQLDSFLKDITGTKQVIGPTGDQLDAYEALKRKAAQGSPYAGQIDTLTNDLFGATSHAGQVGETYDDLVKRLAPTADGARLDPSTNPYIAEMMRTTGDDISNRIKQMFAGAGRDITGNAAGQAAMGRGISAGITPILAQFFDQELARQADAAKTLYTAGTGAAGQQQDMDQAALATRAGGIDAATAALTARDMPENTILNLDQQLKQMPFEDLSLYASLLLPVAGLGGQQQGNSTSKSKGSSFGLSL